jgi:ribosomal-protein-alanine N-acetyltransferase
MSSLGEHHQEQAINFVKARISLNEELGKRALRWAICENSQPDIVIGSCGFHLANKSFSSLEIGYELNQTCWGKNFAYEAVEAVLNYCFKNNFPFVVNRVSATTDLENVKSIKLLQKLGFIEEGVLREFGYWKDKFHDVRLFSLLSRDWKYKTCRLAQP